MQTKLTLRLDSELIVRAKAYAEATGRSVSQLVSDYFALLAGTDERLADETPALVRALHGCLSDSSFDEADYGNYRDAKFGMSSR